MTAYYALVGALGVGVAIIAAVAVSTIVVRRDREAEYGAPVASAPTGSHRK
jgi:hypothetical protein